MFRGPHNDEFVEEVLADDSDMLLITTRQMQLEGELSSLRADKQRLEQVCHRHQIYLTALMLCCPDCYYGFPMRAEWNYLTNV